MTHQLFSVYSMLKLDFFSNQLVSTNLQTIITSSTILNKNNLYSYEVHTISFQTFFVCALLLIVHTWNSSPLWTNLPQLQCTCCTIPTSSGRPHESPLVWACQWPQHSLFHLLNCLIMTAFELREWPKVTGSKVWTIGTVRNCLDAHLGQIVCDKDGVVDWYIVLVEMPLIRFEECWPLPTESLPELP